MGERRVRRGRRRAREFEAFVAGAGGRLLHAAALLTGEPPGAAPAARSLLERALSATYADWDRPRGDDPYARTRERLATRFVHSAPRYRRPRGGVLGSLPPRERLVLVLKLYEGVAEEQISASLGLPVQRVRELCLRGMATALSGPAEGPLLALAPDAGTGPDQRRGPGPGPAPEAEAAPGRGSSAVAGSGTSVSAAPGSVGTGPVGTGSVGTGSPARPRQGRAAGGAVWPRGAA